MRVYVLQFWSNACDAEYDAEPEKVQVHASPTGACDAAIRLATECDISYLRERFEGLEEGEPGLGDRADIIRDFKTHARQWLESDERGSTALESIGPLAMIHEHELLP